MRRRILTALVALGSWANAADLNAGQMNLSKFDKVCLISPSLNTLFQDNGSSVVANSTLENDVFILMRTKLLAYRIPIDEKCGGYSVYLGSYAFAANAGTGYAIAYGLAMEAYGLPGGFDGVKIWTDDRVLAISAAPPVHDRIITDFGKALDRFAADWAISHPLK